MAIRLTKRWAAGEVVTAANRNAHISGPIDDLSGDNGIIQFRDSIQVESGADGDRVLWIPAGTLAERPASPENGQLRYNTTAHRLDGRFQGDWEQVAFISEIPSVDYATLDAAGDVGTGADQLARGNHAH